MGERMNNVSSRGLGGWSRGGKRRWAGGLSRLVGKVHEGSGQPFFTLLEWFGWIPPKWWWWVARRIAFFEGLRRPSFERWRRETVEIQETSRSLVLALFKWIGGFPFEVRRILDARWRELKTVFVAASGVCLGSLVGDQRERSLKFVEKGSDRWWVGGPYAWRCLPIHVGGVSSLIVHCIEGTRMTAGW